MIQRKQSVYLLLAFILTCVCQVMPLGFFRPTEMGTDYVMYTTQIMNDGKSDLSVFPMFAILLVSEIISLATIFLYHNRRRQSKACAWNMAILLLWYACFIIFVFVKGSDNLVFHLSFSLVLPLAALIAVFLARRGIIHDEQLVRAADRIR